MADRYDMERTRSASRSRGQSRARGNQHSAQNGTRYSGGRASSGSRTASGNGVKRNDGYYGRRPGSGDSGAGLIIAAAVALVVVVGALAVAFKGGLMGTAGGSSGQETSAAAETYDPNSIHDDVYLDVSSFASGAELLNLNGMNREQVKNAIMDTYDWKLVVTNPNPLIDDFTMPDLNAGETAEETTGAKTSEVSDNDGSEQTAEVESPYSGITIRPDSRTFEIPDLISEKLEEMIDQIFADYESKKAQETESSAKGKEESNESQESAAPVADYALALPDFTAQVTDYMTQLATVWKMNPKNGDITSYDSSTGEFVFGGSVDGFEIDATLTAEKVMKALKDHNYSASVEAEGKTISASLNSIKDKYEIIGSFTTKTTANSIRNGNIKLAAAAINGTVLQPGEEFSFNEVVGQRTAEKGYGGAPAYNEGEVVTEVGGGVCQVSSTLYNAVFRAGLTTTYRRSHTFAPTYVTPGTDATVSWPGPDYKFVNNSDHAIGIRAWYSDQTMNAQIYGIRILPEGVSWELVSEKAADLPVPEPQLITEGEQSEGTAGSEWQAYKIIHNADGTTEKVKDHYTHYSGHAPKQYTPEIAASLAAESAAAAATDENGETITGTEEGDTSSEAETGGQESERDSDPDNEPEPVPTQEQVQTEANAETNHDAPELPGIKPGDSEISDGLIIGEGPVAGN
ncbi:VanW family protein [Oribacterium sp. P6A1]|uniref:VanW family protein n=1 Tax=Oribacterium sp. P6A1 TaxID=1410612 RepID=UPI00068DECF5|nr:VanW family protein [Oribacterium sp. P6A1]